MSNKKQIAARNRLPLALIPPNVLVHVAIAMAHGAVDYGAYNWREGSVSLKGYVEAALRHILAFSDGEDEDPKTGESHLSHAIASLVIALDAVDLGISQDDRHKSGNVSRLLAEYAEANT